MKLRSHGQHRRPQTVREKLADLAATSRPLTAAHWDSVVTVFPEMTGEFPAHPDTEEPSRAE